MPTPDTYRNRQLPPKGEERQALLLSATAFFMVLCSYYIMRPVRDQLGGAVGSAGLPLFYGVVFLVMLAITPLFGALVARFSRRRLIAICYSFFVVCLLLFVPAFAMQERLGATLLGTVFYAWVSVFNLFVVSLFWSLMADVFNNHQSQRLFPLIGIGGTLGALVGPLLTTALVGIVGVAPLLVISAAVLAAAMGILLYLAHRRGAGAAPAEAIGGSMLAGIKQAFKQPFVRLMAILMLLSDGIGTVAYALLADYANTHVAGRVAQTAFYGRIDFAANLLVIILQVTVTRWLLVRHGAGRALVLAELGNVALFVLLAVFALHTIPLPWVSLETGLVTLAVPAIALIMVGTRGLAYGLITPAANTLYTRAAREARYKGKNFVETAVWRFGDVVVTSSLSALKGLGAGIPLLAGISATAAALAAVTGWRAGQSSDLAPRQTATHDRETVQAGSS